MIVLEVVFWVAVGLLVYTHVGYPLVLALLVRRAVRIGPRPLPGELPRVSLIVAAHDEEQVIEAKVRDALALDYPRELLELIVASDGSTDRTAELARAAGADLVLELGRVGKVEAQNAAVERAGGELLAFSDANARWMPDALRELVAPFARPAGRLRLRPGPLSSTRGARTRRARYWRLELALRALESRLRRGHRRATARSTPSAAAPTCRWDPHRATTSRSRSCSPSAAGARPTRRARSPRRRWSPRSRASSRASGG